MTGVYVILVNWNGWGDTVECLESLLRSEPEGVRVIVCDNGSTDGSLEHLKSWAAGGVEALAPAGPLQRFSFPPVAKPVSCRVLTREEAEEGRGDARDAALTIIDTGANLGFAGGNNVGLRFALSRDDFRYAWLLNNDTVVAPGALARLVERMEEMPQAGICGSTLLRYEEPHRVQAHGGGYYCRWIALPWHLGRLKKAGDRVDRRKVEGAMNYVVGASMLVSKNFLQEVGLLCEDYFLYFEESDWAMRARGRFRLAYAPESVVYHKIGGSIGTSSDPRDKSLACDFYSARNRIFFTRRFFPAALPTVYLSLLGTLLTRALLGKWDRVLLIARVLAGGAGARVGAPGVTEP